MIVHRPQSESIEFHKNSRFFFLISSWSSGRSDRYNLIKRREKKNSENVRKYHENHKKRWKENIHSHKHMHKVRSASHRYQVHDVFRRFFFLSLTFRFSCVYFWCIILSPAFLSCFRVQCAFLHRLLFMNTWAMLMANTQRTDSRHAAFVRSFFFVISSFSYIFLFVPFW